MGNLIASLKQGVNEKESQTTITRLSLPASAPGRKSSTPETSACKEFALYKSAAAGSRKSPWGRGDFPLPSRRSVGPAPASPEFSRAIPPAPESRKRLNEYLPDKDERENTWASHLSGRTAQSRSHSHGAGHYQTLVRLPGAIHSPLFAPDWSECRPCENCPTIIDLNQRRTARRRPAVAGARHTVWRVRLNRSDLLRPAGCRPWPAPRRPSG